jgi:hypothetical protein
MEVTRDRWLYLALHPLLVALMAGCVGYSVLHFLDRVLPTSPPDWLLLVWPLATLEGYVSQRVVERRQLGLGAPAWQIHLVELALLFALLEILFDLAGGLTLFSHGLPRVEGPAVLSFIMLVFCWLAGHDTAYDVTHLNEPPLQLASYVAPGERVAGRFFRGGGLLLLTAGLTVIDLKRAITVTQAPVTGIIVNVLLYFVLGAAMLGQTRYMRLRKNWELHGTQIHAGMARSWLRYSAILLAISALGAYLLPTAYTVGFLDTIRGSINLVLEVFAGIFALGIGGVSALLQFLHIGSSHGAHALPPPRVPPAQHHRPTPSHPLTWLRVAVFWTLLAAALVLLIRNNSARLDALGRAIRPLGWLRAVARGIWFALVGHWREGVGTARRLLQREPKSPDLPAAPAPVQRVWWPGRLAPREQVLYYYASLLRRARRMGLPERGGATPYEYETTLAPHTADSADDLAELTAAFVQARYSGRPVEAVQARAARSYWWRASGALRRRSRGQ